MLARSTYTESILNFNHVITNTEYKSHITETITNMSLTYYA